MVYDKNLKLQKIEITCAQRGKFNFRSDRMIHTNLGTLYPILCLSRGIDIIKNHP